VFGFYLIFNSINGSCLVSSLEVYAVGHYQSTVFRWVWFSCKSEASLSIFNMTVVGDTGRGNPFKSLTQRIGNLFSKGPSSETPALLNDIIGASSGIMGDVQNMHKQSSHNSAHHGESHHNEHDNHSSHGGHAEYQFSPYFERAVELINTAAGLIVMASVILAGINIILVALNANFGKF
jgi:hypothetical protein